MAAIVTVFLLAWTMIAWMPDVSVSRSLRLWLVETPAAFMVRMTLGYALLFGFVISTLPTLAEFEGGDGLRMAMTALPELTTWAATFEVATLVEAVVAVGAAWSTLRTGARTGAWWRPRKRLPHRVRRATRTRIVTDDDEDRWERVSAA